MSVFFKITETLLDHIKRDLIRRHPFTYERVGFLTCRAGVIEPEGWVLLGADYYPVEDDDYLPDETVGALIGPTAIRKALQIAYNEPVSIVHVHLHSHRGQTHLSEIDEDETAKLIPNFWNVRPNLPHAAVVFSLDSMCGFLWDPVSKKRLLINDFTIVDAPMKFIR
jgi:hypothetical protein